jgi:FkbM family methyltransferase
LDVESAQQRQELDMESTLLTSSPHLAFDAWTWAAIKHLLLMNLNVLSSQSAGREGAELLRSAFFDLARRTAPTLFCDVGAFDGIAATEFKRRNPECRVYAFEANPEIFSRFETLHHGSGVDYRNLAIDNRSGTATIFAPRMASRLYVDGQFIETTFEEPADSGRSSMLRRNEAATYAEFEVPSRTLDEFILGEGIDHLNETIVLWIDVEGAVDRVIRGASQTLSRTAVVLVETETERFWQGQFDSSQVCNSLMDLGFVPVARDREYHDFQFNILFVHADYLLTIYPELFVASSSLRACIGTRSVELAKASRSTDNTSDVDRRSLPNRDASRVSPVRQASSISELFLQDIPILIPAFENPAYVRNMIDQLRSRHLDNIVVVDNASTSPEMQAFLGSDLGATVVRLDRNFGPRHVFLDDDSFFSLPDLFCVTDPDLEFNPNLPSDFMGKLVALTERYRVGKAGFSLDISDKEAMRQEKFRIGGVDYTIWDWEQQFWTEPLGQLDDLGTVYRASIDTTFAVYNKRFFDRRRHMEAVRVAGVFACRHLPWYPESLLTPEQEELYRARAQHSYYLGCSTPPE